MHCCGVFLISPGLLSRLPRRWYCCEVGWGGKGLWGFLTLPLGMALIHP